MTDLAVIELPACNHRGRIVGPHRCICRCPTIRKSPGGRVDFGQCQACPESIRGAPAVSLPHPLACIHRGEVARQAPCSCKNGKKIPVYSCMMFGECVRTTDDRTRLTAADKELATRKACDNCKEKQPPAIVLPVPS